MTDTTTNHDVIIIGGGLVGLPLAIACAQGGVSVAVVDTSDPTRTLQTHFDGRVSALNQSTFNMLNQIGVWRFIHTHAQPILKIHVIESGTTSCLQFNSQRHQQDTSKALPFGYMVQNHILRRAIQKRFTELTTDSGGTISYFAPTQTTSIDRTNERTTVKLVSGQTLSAPLVVAADGRNSPLRTAAFIPHHGWSYNQVGIILAMHHEKPHNGIALEKFTPGGPFAVLPVVDDDGRHQSGVVWCEEPRIAKKILALNDQQFAVELNHRVGTYLGKLYPQKHKWSFPLALSHAKRYYSKRLALVGDAAHAMHPIAGQGLNLGLRDAAILSQIIIENRRLGLDIGTPSILKKYDQERRIDALALMGITDGLTRLFNTRQPFIQFARHLGMKIVENNVYLKTFFTHHATRGSGDPKVARLLLGLEV